MSELVKKSCPKNQTKGSMLKSFRFAYTITITLALIHTTILALIYTTTLALIHTTPHHTTHSLTTPPHDTTPQHPQPGPCGHFPSRLHAPRSGIPPNRHLGLSHETAAILSYFGFFFVFSVSFVVFVVPAAVVAVALVKRRQPLPAT